MGFQAVASLNDTAQCIPYAIQAGREVRVLVDAASVDDATAAVRAREIATRIEKELDYPGEVRVTVIRETRAVDYAK